MLKHLGYLSRCETWIPHDTSNGWKNVTVKQTQNLLYLDKNQESESDGEMQRMQKGAAEKFPGTQEYLILHYALCHCHVLLLPWTFSSCPLPTLLRCAGRWTISPEAKLTKRSGAPTNPTAASPPCKPRTKQGGLSSPLGVLRRPHLHSSFPLCACAWAAWASHAGQWCRTGRRFSRTHWVSHSLAAPTRLPRVVPPAASPPYPGRTIA